jgi:hypothetical protein
VLRQQQIACALPGGGGHTLASLERVAAEAAAAGARPRSMQAAWEELRARGAGAAPLDAERMAELLCGGASPAAVLAALRALAADLSHFKQVCAPERCRALAVTQVPRRTRDQERRGKI